MFDIGFAELVIIGVVSLLVIGPERLPGTVRTVSAWLGRLRRGFNDIKQEVQQELHNDEMMRELRETGEQIKRETDGLTREFNVAGNSIRQQAESLTKPLPGDDSSAQSRADSGPEDTTDSKPEPKPDGASESDAEGAARATPDQDDDSSAARNPPL